MWPVAVEPLPLPPLAKDLPAVERHLGMWCGCLLLDCCHNEDRHPHGHGRHVDSGDPRSGYLYPWEPGDESWREEWPLPFAVRR